MLADYHIHTEYSFDSETPMMRQIERAHAAGLSELCFTDHMELDFHRPLAELDAEAYLAGYRGLGETPIPVKFGLEAGISCRESSKARVKSVIRDMPFDFVIASLHMFNGTDPFQEAFFQGRDAVKICRDYIQELFSRLTAFGAEYFSVVGHIDYPAKGYGYKYLHGGKFRYEWAADELDTLFRYLIENGKAIEINTSSYRRLTDGRYPGHDWLARYAELGGEYVTLGSDAHIPEHIGLGLDTAAELAKQAGIRYYATFDRMKPEFHAL